jgi:Arc/MetJ-type ribon-helix-helix transcriptional regulator
MVKTTVYLPEDLKRDLERLADESGRSEADLIREGVAQLVAAEQRPRPTLPLFESGEPTLAERVDEALADFGS